MAKEEAVVVTKSMLSVDAGTIDSILAAQSINSTRIVELETKISTMTDAVYSVEFENFQADQANNTASIVELKAEINVVTDFADDILAGANNVLTVADSLITTYLLVISLAATAIVTIVGLWFSKRREDHLKDATEKFIDSLSEDEQLMKIFSGALVQHPNIVQNINTAIDRASREIASQKSSSEEDTNKAINDIADSVAVEKEEG